MAVETKLTDQEIASMMADRIAARARVPAAG